MKSDSSGYTEIADGAKYNIHRNGSLSIVDAQKEDDGTYMVEISNSVGTATEEIQVELLQKTGIYFVLTVFLLMMVKSVLYY